MWFCECAVCLLLGILCASCSLPSAAGLRLKAEEWNQAHLLANGYSPRQCQPIPENMTLCQSVGYSNMVLPNHFQLESAHDAVLQSNAWLPLVKVNCHPELTRFLCSLYAPVCVKGHQELKIFPCKSLCANVKAACFPLMQRFGFSWPHRLSCERFPENNEGLCIQSTQGAETPAMAAVESRSTPPTPPPPPPTAPPALSTKEPTLEEWFARRPHMMADGQDQECPVCRNTVPLTKEKLWKSFCEADLTMKTKIKRVEVADGLYKIHLGTKSIRKFSDKTQWNGRMVTVCPCSWLRSPSVTTGNWLLMAKKQPDQSMSVTRLVILNRDSVEFKKAIRKIRRKGAELCQNAAAASFLQMVAGKMTMTTTTTKTPEKSEKSSSLNHKAWSSSAREKRQQRRKKRLENLTLEERSKLQKSRRERRARRRQRQRELKGESQQQTG